MATSSDDPAGREEAPALRVRLRGELGPVTWGVIAAAVSLVTGLVLDHRAAGVAPDVPVVVQVALWLLPVAAMWLSLGRTVRVGSDGIALGWGLRRVFVPATDVGEVLREYTAVRSGWVLVVKRRGNRPPLRLRLVSVADERVDAIEARIRGLIARTSARAAALTALHRGERDGVGWRRDMAALLAGGGFRSAAISAEDLQEVLDDPGASGEQKLGAALALRGAGGAMDRERVRIAAVASARPKLRVALEKVATEEEEPDQAIAEALAESDAEAREGTERGG
ncbi:MAG: hypothetical protein WKG00_22120 [Polyangiaceae bacterium]